MQRNNLLISLILSIFTILPSLALGADFSVEREVQNSLMQSKALISIVAVKQQASQPVSGEIVKLKDLAALIRTNHQQLSESFVTRSDVVERLGGVALQRHNLMNEQYLSVLADYLMMVESLGDNEIPSLTLENLRSLLESFLPKREQPILGSLPYKKLRLPAKAPLSGPAITPAYLGGNKTVSEADMASTDEAPISLEIAQLAESLHWNPVEIYAWVKNNIKTEWYWGLMKGAEETLRQQSGNDADQAALLVALMRSAGFPSRFVHGTIEFFPNLEVAKNITGISDVQELLVFFQKAGIPCQPVIGGGKVANIQIEHIWVESQVPYANYRGVVIDEHGKSWLGLDTSIKAAGFTENTPADLPSGFDLAGFRDLYLQEVRTETPLEFLRSNLEQAGAVYDELLLTRSQSAEDLKLLPASLQFKQVAVTGEYTSLPSELKHQARFVAKAGSETLFDITLNVMNLTGRSIAIIYEPSNVEDQEIINSYGSLYNTPSYLVHLRPVLTVDGQRLAVGTSGLAVGDDFLLQVDLLAYGHIERIENRLIIGNLAVIGLAAQKVTAPDDIPLQDKNGEYLLHEQALNYIDRWNQAEDELASLLHLSLARPLPTLVTLGGVVEVTWLLDMPHGFEWKGVYMDADLRAVEFSGDPESGKSFLRLSGLQGSILENRVFEDGFSVDSISTAKLLAYTNVNGLPLAVIDSSNVDSVLPSLDLPSNIVEDITHAVNQGMVVTIPQLDTLYEDWLGTGYLKEDPVTGESGWMLSGIIAGSQTAWSPAQWEEYLSNSLSYPNATLPNTDLDAGVNLKQIQQGITRSGIVGKEVSESLQTIVTDRNNKAVSGAFVRFAIKNGGGTLSTRDGSIAGQSWIVVKTNYLGIAEVKLTLGLYTSDNPVMVLDSGETYSQQVGLNIVEARLENGSSIDSPFFAYGYPDSPFRINKTDGDDLFSAVLIYSSRIVAKVEDKHGNPISNQTVKFTSQPSQSLTDSQTCPNPGPTDKALLVADDDHCRDEWRTYENCADYAIGGDEPTNTSLSLVSKHDGAFAGVVLGGMAQAKYSIDVASGNLQDTFNHFSWPDVDCSLNDDPKHTVAFATKFNADSFGNEINAGPLGTVFPFESSCYLIEEQTGTDGYGNGRYKIIKEFDANVEMITSYTAAEITTEFDDYGEPYYLNGNGERVEPGTDFNGDTIYWPAGLWFSSLSGVTTMPNKKDADGNNISGIYTGELTLSSQPRVYTAGFWCWVPISDDTLSVGFHTKQVHSVGIKTHLDQFVSVDEGGQVSEDYNINYSIEPVDYKAGTVQLIIYEKNAESLTPVSFIPGSSLSGAGTVTLPRGFEFDLSKKYSVEVALNYQTGVEIRSEVKPLKFVQIAINKIEIEDNKYPIPIGGKAQAIAKTTPNGRAVDWLALEQDDGVDVKINKDTGVITVTKDSDSGWFTFRAYDRKIPAIYKDAKVYIGCSTCSDNSCVIPGKELVQLSSVDISLGIGMAEGGQSAGELFIKSAVPSQKLATPEGLALYSLRGVEGHRDNQGNLRQILSEQSLIDILTIDDYRYELKFYRSSDILPDKTSEGLYQVADTATPLVTWRLENPDASPDKYDTLILSQLKSGAVTKKYTYKYFADIGTWTLDKGDGAQVISKEYYTDPTTNDRIVIETVRTAGGEVASVTRKVYRDFIWGVKLVEETVDPDGAALTTYTDYNGTSAPDGSIGRIKSVINPDNSWVRYEYDGLGRTRTEIRSWLDAPVGAEVTEARATYYSYELVDLADSDSPLDVKSPRMVTEEIQGTVVSRTYYAYIQSQDGSRIEIVEQAATPSSEYNVTGNIRTETTYYPSGTDLANSGKVVNTLSSDGSNTSYTYEYGTYAAGDSSRGTFSVGDGKDVRRTVINGTSTQPEGIANKTTSETTISDRFGNTVEQYSSIYTGSGYEPYQWSVNILDEFGRPEKTIYSDGTSTDTVWGCCSKDSSTDRDGITTSYVYDTMDRPAVSIREGMRGDVTTTAAFDAAGRRVTNAVESQGLSQFTESKYDNAGRLDHSVSAAGLVTDYEYSSDGLVTTVTHPGGATEITTNYTDGRIKSITGTGVVAQYYEYEVIPDGSQWTKVSVGSPTSLRWQTSYTDMLGWTVKSEKPGYNGTVITQNFYNDLGQLVRTETTGQGAIIFEYDELGRQYRSGIDIDGNLALDLASLDRITGTDTQFTKIGSDWWQEASQYVYAKANDATRTRTFTRRSRLSSFVGGVVSESVNIDILGNETVFTSTLDRANKRRNTTVNTPDATNDQSSVFEYGLLVSSTSKTGFTVTYDYDALGRRTGINDPRTGRSSTHYDANGRVDYVEDAAANRTTFGYDPVTGRKAWEKNGLDKYSRYLYNDRSQVTNTWGDATYPITYLYGEYGQRTHMYTYQNGTGWNSATWPADTGTAAATIWHYNDATGLLTGKEDVAGKLVSYSYAAANQLKSRTWARKDAGSPLTTTYVYDPATSELTDIDYSDTTVDVSFTYDRLGRQKTITDAVGTRTFVYKANLQPDTESITGLYDKTLTRKYDGLGRSIGFTAGADYATTYGYDVATGRFASVSWDAGGSAGSTTYGYLPNSNLLRQATFSSGQVATYGYETNRNLKTQVRNEFGATLISQYDYSYDDIGRRANVANSGSAFTADAFNIYGYNDRNELTVSDRYLGMSLADTSHPVSEETRGYSYDSIGNRTDVTGWDEAQNVQMQLTYTANKLNQYDLINSSTGPDSTPIYDEDGNMTEYEEKLYTYNAENRLIMVEPSLPTEGDSKAEYIYDYMGRRVEKSVSSYSAGSWLQTYDSLFLYDVWNMIAELDATGQPTVSYVWGLDLSQSMQGAGGIGGLLARVEGATDHTYTYDANGNVGQMLDGAGSIGAHYEYDPYGNAVNAAGALADVNPYRFSTKYLDSESGLYYYGYRYYLPELGRWLTRDPIGEQGGLNLYNFVFNNPVSGFDKLGLFVHPSGIISPEQAYKDVQAIEAKAKKGLYKSTRYLMEMSSFYSTSDTDGGAPGTVGNKWVFTCKYGWLDLGHFFTNAWIEGIVPGRKDGDLVYWGSDIGMEKAVQKTALDVSTFLNYRNINDKYVYQNAQSAYTFEDLNSNYQGSHFKHNGAGTIASSFKDFLINSGAVTNLTKVEIDTLKKDVKSVLTGDLGEYSGKRLQTKEQQLQYQKNILGAFNCFCDGGVPREKYRYE